MIEMLIVWALVPLLLVLLCYGLGLTLSLAVRKPLSSTLATVIGFLAMTIVGSLTTMSTDIAPYTSLIFAVVSVAGLFVCAIWCRAYIRLDYLPALAGFLTYIGFSMPVVAYGSPSWAGWIKLDDTGTWFAITDRIMNVGNSIPSVVNSTFDRVIAVYLGGNQFNYGGQNGGHFSYPLGSFIPFGVISKLTGVEKAWIFQPYLSLTAGLGAMIFVLILRAHLSNRVLLVAICSLSMLASTIYSYVMWGGIKEIVLIIPLATFSYSFFEILDKGLNREHSLSALVAIFGLFFIGGKTSLGIVFPILLVGLLIKLWQKNLKAFYTTIGMSGAAVLLFVYMLNSGNAILTKFFVPQVPDTGNLVRSLNPFQVMGIWPSQDFREDPLNIPSTILLISIAILFTLFGLYSAIKAHLWAVPALLTSLLCIVAYSYFYAGIWLTGKAMAVASPFFVLAALMGVHYAWVRAQDSSNSNFWNWKIHYLVVISAVTISSGVLISDVMTYKNVSLAPYSQMNELETIGRLFAGQGPALMTEYSVFGSRYFLRKLDAEAASELRVHVIPMSDGSQLSKGAAADISLFDSDTINYYNLLVLRKSATASRPPLNYKLIWSGTHYDVWKRIAGAPKIWKMLSLGNNFSPGAAPSCKVVDAFLSSRTKAERIFAVVRDKSYMVDFANGDLPTGWRSLPYGAVAVDRPSTDGFSRTFSVDETRRYDVSLAGSFPGQLTLLVDGEQIYVNHSLFENNNSLTMTLAAVQLSAGRHVLTVLYKTPLFMPGTDAAFAFGPIYFSTQFAGDAKVEQVSISRIPQLCTQNLDWIAITD